MKITPESMIGSYNLEVEYDGVKLHCVISIDTETGECIKYKYPLERTTDGEEFATETLALDPAKLHVYICKPVL